MQVIVTTVGQIVVDNQVDILHIDAAGRNIAGAQDADLAVIEPGHYLPALFRRHLPVQAGAAQFVVLQQARQAHRGAALVAEHQHALEAAPFQQGGQQLVLVLLSVRQHDLVGDSTVGLTGGTDRDAARCPEQGIADRPQLPVIHRGRYHDGLPRARAAGVDLQHIVPEAHVQHSVGLVQYQDLQKLQAGALAFAVLQQTPRGGDDDFGIFTKQGLLVAKVGAAGNAVHLQRRFCQQRAAVLEHLPGQFTRGNQDQAQRAVPARRIERQQLLHHGHQVGESLAAAGFGADYQVIPRQRGGNHLVLDLGGGSESQSIQRQLQSPVQLQMFQHGIASFW